MTTDALLEIKRLVVSFSRRGGDWGAPRLFNAVDDVTLEINAGEVLGLVGESGSGKTTLAKALLRLYRPSGGRILFGGTDLAPLGERALKPYRRHLQMVFQDPISSFNPRHTVADSLAIPLRLHRLCPKSQTARRVDETLGRVGLSPRLRDRFPHELSGGQLQRVAIGRALILSPRLLVADEAVSKLDVSVRAQILNLLKDVREANALSILFVTHDLHVARYLCDRIGVMYFGKLVEIGRTEDVLTSPRHPYTRALVDTLKEDDAAIPDGETAMAPPSQTGCRYASRCTHAVTRCVEAHPELVEIVEGHAAACWRWRELAPAKTDFSLAHER